MKIPLWLLVFITGVVVVVFCESVAWLVRRLRSYPVDDCPTTLPIPPSLKEKCEAAERILEQVRNSTPLSPIANPPPPAARTPAQPELDENDYAVLLRMVDELRRRMANASGALQSAERELKLTRQRLDESADWLNKLDKLMTKIAAKVGNLDLHEGNER